jgi:hypothetical protein
LAKHIRRVGVDAGGGAHAVGPGPSRVWSSRGNGQPRSTETG